jgi:hypothetical protein
MFCSECGKESTGKFCWNCGAPLHAGGGTQPAPPAAVPSQPPAAAPPPVPADWQYEVDYETLIRNPEVRDLLAKQKPAAVRMTGEEFAETFGKILKSPVSLAPVMSIMQDVNGRLGVHTGKTRSQSYRQPVGRVIASALCALARGGHKVQDVRQASDGCMLICEIPSDMFSLAGQLLVTIHREPEGASVHADTRIEGQLFDWGKSNACLNQLFSGIGAGA